MTVEASLESDGSPPPASATADSIAPSRPRGLGGRGTGGLVDVYQGIILLATFTTLVPYAFCAVAELLLAVPHRGDPDSSRRRLVVTAGIGLLAFVFSFFCIIGAGADTALKGFVGLLLGLPVFAYLQRRQFVGGASPEPAAAVAEA